MTGTLGESEEETAVPIEFEVTQEMVSSGAALYAFDGYAPAIDTIMIVKDIPYPDIYYPYGEIQVDATAAKLDNFLWEKKAIFFGDSICAGTTVGEIPEKGYGWAGLIGVENNMEWQNSGQNGAAFVSGLSAGRTIISQVTTEAGTFFDSDFVVFEGGTNDADELGADGLGEISSVWDGFDTSTFSGAFEDTISSILNLYPNASYLYVIPPKMGLNQIDAPNSVRRLYFDQATKICRKWGIPVCDLWHNSPLNPNLAKYWLGNNESGPYYTDGQHLTLKGYKAIYAQIANAIRHAH